MKWSAYTVNVDMETGEKITNLERDKQYYIIKKTKYVKRFNTGGGIIEYTNQCRKRPEQRKLF